MYNIVLKTLETYIRDKRMATQNEMNAEDLSFLSEQKSIFVTLYQGDTVVASAGRIQPIKENSLAECMDISLHCLKDSRFAANINNPEILKTLHIRVDSFTPAERRRIKDISEITDNDGLILLSQNLGKMSVILPKMLKNFSPENMLATARKKADIWMETDTSDMFLYAFQTTIFKNF